MCPLVLTLFLKPTERRGNDGRTRAVGRPHDSVALVPKYGPVIYHRLRGKLKYTTTTWHMDETYVRIAGRWVYLFRAVVSHGDTVDFYLSETRDREAAKTFLQKALSNPDNRFPQSSVLTC